MTRLPRLRAGRRPPGLAALALSGVCAGLLVHGAQAQEAGRELNIGTSLGVQANDNLNLDSDSEGSTTSATAGFDFALLLANIGQSFALSGDFQLRSSNGPDEDAVSDGLSSADLRLRYNRESRDARFGVNGFLSRREVALIEPLDIVDLLDPDGDGVPNLDDPLVLDDLDVATQRGTRLSFGLDTTLELRRTAPFGIILSAGLSGLRYDDSSTGGLEDENRHRAGIGLRFDLNPVTQARLDLDYSSYEQDNDDEGRRDTFVLSLDLNRATQAGSIGLVTEAVSTEDGERFTLGLERSLDLPLWTLTGQIGATRTEGGDVLPTGRLSASRDLRQGALSLDLTREVRSGSDDEERRVTGLSLDYSRPLTPLTSMGLDLSYLRSDATGDNDETESFGRAAIELNRTLSEDWSLSVSLAHRIEDNGFADRAHDNRISFDLRRQVTFRP
ncbi:hypothetical protein LX81_03290 [Palleronia aestuarii]|uniref:Beta-barrel porin 2 n=1 Tax=Palleronia aestuarii TaxID=568105 RepID=A0A2W7MZE0_9RHOB|nr:hypothetical protein [Palleronia aestuarii]PZX13505.1 hypothetical protein LX81_03290 [Palleronia aestuarii]